MGCWNKTCSLTNLPIFSGEAVYVFVLEKRKLYSQCYATGHYTPVYLPFESEYNDYGGGRDSGGIGFKLVLDAIRKKLIEIEMGENRYHDIAIKRSEFDEKLFFDGVVEQRLIVKDFFGKEVPVDYAMMRKDCVDAILNTWEIEGCERNYQTNKTEYFVYGYDDLLDEIPAYINVVQKQLEQDPLKLRLTAEVPLECSKLDAFLNFDRASCSSILSGRNLFYDLLEAGDTEQAEEFIKQFLKGVMLNFFFECTRKQWLPGGHEGSQEQDYNEYELLLQVTQEAIDRKKQE